MSEKKFLLTSNSILKVFYYYLVEIDWFNYTLYFHAHMLTVQVVGCVAINNVFAQQYRTLACVRNSNWEQSIRFHSSGGCRSATNSNTEDLLWLKATQETSNHLLQVKFYVKQFWLMYLLKDRVMLYLKDFETIYHSCS